VSKQAAGKRKEKTASNIAPVISDYNQLQNKIGYEPRL
jgi:hypothetical protein